MLCVNNNEKEDFLNRRFVSETIAKNVATKFSSGQIINLGIGLPTLVSNYIPEEMNITIFSENGVTGMGALISEGIEDKNVINAGGQFVKILAHAAFFDTLLSFSLIRGGHIDVTVLGALEVDELGNLANWIIPGKKTPGIGGGMDLAVGAKKVIVAMTMASKGKSKILKRCKLPLTAKAKVKLIVTERAVFEITPSGLLLIEIHPMTTIGEIRELTEAEFKISSNLKQMVV